MNNASKELQAAVEATVTVNNMKQLEKEMLQLRLDIAEKGRELSNVRISMRDSREYYRLEMEELKNAQANKIAELTAMREKLTFEKADVDQKLEEVEADNRRLHDKWNRFQGRLAVASSSADTVSIATQTLGVAVNSAATQTESEAKQKFSKWMIEHKKEEEAKNQELLGSMNSNRAGDGSSMGGNTSNVQPGQGRTNVAVSTFLQDRLRRIRGAM